MADDRPEQLFVLQRNAPKTDKVNRQAQKARGSMIYRRGSQPQWAGDEDSSEDDIVNADRGRIRSHAKKGGTRAVKMEKIERQVRRPAEPVVLSSRTIAEPVVVKAEQGDEDEDVQVESKDPVHVKKELDIDISSLEIPEGPEEDSEEEEGEEEDVDDRRAAMRRRKLQKMKEEEEQRKQTATKEEDKKDEVRMSDMNTSMNTSMNISNTLFISSPLQSLSPSRDLLSPSRSLSSPLPPSPFHPLNLYDEDEDEDEDESEYESDSEESVARPMLKPVFVSKRQRQTIEERERMEAEEEAYEEELRQREKERKEQAKKMVIAHLKAEEEAKLKSKEEEMPDDTDGLDEEEEIKAWKLRELRRIKRENDFRERHKKDQEEIEKRRNMTDEQIEALNRVKSEKDRGNMKFLQKYFHKGAFFQDEDHEIFKRDFNQATGLDREVDRSALPKVLQVKNFGLMSRTKYTHLVDQDTTYSSGKSKRELEDEEELKLKFRGKRKLAGTGRIDNVFRKKTKSSDS
eukprot:1355613-Amorphochlora_amoeboformis.AAC.1